MFVANGTGFRPLRSILDGMIRRRLNREVRFYWGGRSRADLYLAETCEKWEKRYPWFTFLPVLSEPDANWRGRRGLVHAAVRRSRRCRSLGLFLNMVATDPVDQWARARGRRDPVADVSAGVDGLSDPHPG